MYMYAKVSAVQIYEHCSSVHIIDIFHISSPVQAEKETNASFSIQFVTLRIVSSCIFFLTAGRENGN